MVLDLSSTHLGFRLLLKYDWRAARTQTRPPMVIKRVSSDPSRRVLARCPRIIQSSPHRPPSTKSTRACHFLFLVRVSFPQIPACYHYSCNKPISVLLRPAIGTSTLTMDNTPSPASQCRALNISDSTQCTALATSLNGLFCSFHS